MSEKTEIAPDNNGYWELFDRPISKAGVFEYLGARLPGAADPARMYRVLRPEEELGSPETVESFKLQPWVIGHELLGPDWAGLTPPENKGVHGVIGEQVYYRDGVLYANLKGFSQTLREEIEAGTKQLSCGYFHSLEWKPGVWQGQPYDAVQRNIRANHLALVRSGRMGPEVAATDGAEQGFDPNFFNPAGALSAENQQEQGQMPDELNGQAPDQPGGQGITLEKVMEAVKALADRLAKLEGAAPGGGQQGQTPPAPGADADDNAAQGAPGGEPADDAPKMSAQDADEPGDEEPKADEAKSASMDAAEVYQLVRKDMAAREKLTAAIIPYVGTFDHAEMTAREVAAYGCKKLGISCPAGQEEAALAGYLAAAGKKAERVYSLDAAPVRADAKGSPALEKYLKEGN